MAAAAHREQRKKPFAAREQADTTSWFNRTILVSLLLVFASGASALIFQVLWVKQLSLVVGVDIHAITIAVSGFFAGLAVGGWLFGARAELSSQPMRLYCVIELAIAFAGIGCSFVLANFAATFATIENSLGSFSLIIPFGLVCIPATLMGGTVPVLLRAIVRETTPVSVLGGYLYAANTAGAVLGALLVPFYLIPHFGVFDTAVYAGGINAVVAFAAYALNPTVPVQKSDEDVGVNRPQKFKLALWLYSIAGGVALGYELIWSQILVQWTSTRSFAFAVVLAVYLAGIMIGSALSAPSANGCRDPWTRFGFLICAAGTIALLQVFVLGEWLSRLQLNAATFAFQQTGSESAAMMARFLTAACSVLLLPTLLLGAAFPTALKLTVGNQRVGRDAGIVLAANTVGGIAGTFAVGFILVPMLGLERALAFLAIIAAVVGVIAALAAGVASRVWLRALTILCAVTTVGLAIGLGGDHLAQQWSSGHKGKLLFHCSGAAGTVAVVEQGTDDKTFRRLYIQGVSNSGDSMTSLRYMRLQTLLPLLIHRGEPKSALVIGLGTGITAGATLCYEGLQRRVCAELLPEVAQAVTMFQGNYGAGKDDRLKINLIDGRRELLRSSERYDMITLEPPPPSAAGVVNLYSSDFYRLASGRLNENGLLAQWLPLPTQTDSDTRSLVQSFLEVFPYATLWTTELHEMMLIGSMTPIELDAIKISSRFEQPDVSKTLKEVGIESPSALLATYICDRSGLVDYAGSSPSVTDNQPRIEYASWVLKEDFSTTLIALMAHQSEPVFVNANQEVLSAIAYQRQTLQTFYASGLAAYNKDLSLWQRDYNTVLNRDPENPYYRWFAASSSKVPDLD